MELTGNMKQKNTQQIKHYNIGSYDVRINTDLADTNWDNFLQRVDAGHHVQSSLWARLKNIHNWHPVHVTMSSDGQIVAGAQFLTKRISFFGHVGYLPQGPVIDQNIEINYAQIMQMIDYAMKQSNILMTFLVPPRNGQEHVHYMETQGLKPHNLSWFPRATTMVDLSPDIDTILSNMKSKTRYNVRYADKKGINVREVGRENLAEFHQLLQQTARRNEFTPYSLDYFKKMFDIFNEDGHFRLLFADYEGSTVSSILLIAFGDTVLYKKGGWAGEKGNMRPNEALHWAAIQWAKENGYQYYDFEGIREDAALSAIAGESIPNDALNTYSRFKLGFGGEVLILPKTYIYSPNPLIRWLGQKPQLVAHGLKILGDLRS